MFVFGTIISSAISDLKDQRRNMDQPGNKKGNELGSVDHVQKRNEFLIARILKVREEIIDLLKVLRTMEGRITS